MFIIGACDLGETHEMHTSEIHEVVSLDRLPRRASLNQT